MATYKQVQQEVKVRNGISVKTCWIAHVKELNGLAPRNAPNRHSATSRVHPCPDRVRPFIEEAMRRLGVIAVVNAGA